MTALDDEGYGTPTPQTPPSSYSITTTAVNPFFHVVLFPVKTGLTLPTVQSLMTTNGSSFALDWGGTYSDQSVFRYNDGIVASPNVSTDAKIALVRVNKSLEMPETFSVTDGSQLTYNGQTIANLFGQVGTIMQSRTEVEMYGPAITDFYIYAPIAASVKINDITVSFVRNGNYVQSTDIVNIPSSLSPYWNMVSLPLTPLNFAKAAVWPTATSPAWAYPPGGTVATDPLVLGQGYWTEFGSSAQGINYLGLPVGVQSIPVYNASGNFGWNLIGTISTPVDISTITSIPSGNLTSGYFGFNPSAGYYLVQTLQPGNAYWVKVAQNGTLTLGTSGYSPPPPITLSQPPNPVDAPPIPTLSYPQNGTTSVPIPTTLSWFEADEAATSHLQVASDSLFTNVVDNEVGLTQTTQTISDVSYATKYYWRVNCTDTATSDWSNAKWFTTEVQPPPPPPPPPGGCTNCCAYSTMTLDQLTVTDAGGYSQSMYTLNSGRSTNWRFNNFDMPPAPPKGNIFHAHFQSGKFIEFIPPHNSVTTIPIVMKNVKYPVNLSWNIRKENNASYWYTNSKQKKVAMAGSGSAVIQSTNNGTLVITAQASQPCLPIDTRSARQEDADETSSIPTSYALIQNYPNPFNPITSIEYDLPKTGYVRLVVYDVLGRIVATLVNGVQAAGYRTVSFDGSRYPSGIYFYRIQAEGFMDVKKMALAK